LSKSPWRTWLELRRPTPKRDHDPVEGGTALPWVARHKMIVCVAAALVWLGALYIQAWWNPRTAFLIPSRKAEWILHPDNRDLKLHLGTFSDDAVFRKRFALTRLPDKAEVRVRTMTESRISINGRILPSDGASATRNWKRSVVVDLRPYLQAGENIILVHARNPTGVAALQFESSLDGVELHSGASWEVAKGGWARWVSATVAGHPAKSASKAMVVLLFIYGLYLLAAVTPTWVKDRFGLATLFTSRGGTTDIETVPKKLLLGAIFGGLSGLALRNAFSYPPFRGFDARGHIEYVLYVASQWRVPLAAEGWSLHHPPLFYTLAAALYASLSGNVEATQGTALKAVQFISAASAVGSVVCAYLSLRQLYPNDNTMQLLGVSVAAFLPMNLYMMGMITNETMAAFMISLALYLLLRVGFKKDYTVRDVCLLGVLNGLALLTKVTALFVFLTTGIILLMRIFELRSARKRRAAYLMAFTFFTALVSGWFFLRNFGEHGMLYVRNWAQTSEWQFFQKPGYRTLGFYGRFGSVLLGEPDRDLLEISLLDGEYGTMWGEAHRHFVRTKEQKHLSRIIMLLAVVPTVALLIGFCQSVRDALDPPYPNPWLALVLLTGLTLTAAVYYTLQQPFYSSIKAFFFLSLLAPFAVFAARGLRTMARNLGRLQPLLYAHLGLLYALIVATFWYRD